MTMADHLTGNLGKTDHNGMDVGLKTGIKTLEKLSEGKKLLPPWLFRHEDLFSALKSAQILDRKKLINMLNYIHFTEGRLYALFHHPRYDEGILLSARPEPCLDDRFACNWVDRYPHLDLSQYQFRYLVVTSDQFVVLVPASPLETGPGGLIVQLPEASYSLSLRKIARFPCCETDVELMQSGFLARGELIDFSPLAFRVRVKPEVASSFVWFNPEIPSTVHLSCGQKILFAGSCSCIRQEQDLFSWEMVLKPLDKEITRYPPRKQRNTRYQITPTPTIAFVHPFFKKRIQREIVNISHSGFSVHEKTGESVLLPGMIIPELSIIYAGILRMTGTAQVIRYHEDSGQVVCGLAILDMDLNQYTSLSQILGYLNNSNTYVSNKVDMEALWEFLFDANFIYPKKYRLLQSYRADFKETYRKLYQESPEIAQHFTYEKDGRIYAHASLVRAYERSWLGHHLAARPMEGKRTGFIMVKHVADYLGGLSRLPSANMGYLMFYFRPDNTFMYKIFGETAENYAKPLHCSADVFAYVPYTKANRQGNLPDGWFLREATALDLWELELSYKQQSGGLLFEALDIRGQGGESLKRTYERAGFRRDMKIYSLLHGNNLKAGLIIDQSDLGINLSELLNSVKVIVIDSRDLSWAILSLLFDRIADLYPLQEVPFLIYPRDYADTWQVPFEKHYLLWILAVRHSKSYVEFIQEKFGINIRD
jgi:hypothetical protein